VSSLDWLNLPPVRIRMDHHDQQKQEEKVMEPVLEEYRQMTESIQRAVLALERFVRSEPTLGELGIRWTGSR